MLCRSLICKVEEIHLSLRKHLAKEEDQLFPLLLKHFTFPEQASLYGPDGRPEHKTEPGRADSMSYESES